MLKRLLDLIGAAEKGRRPRKSQGGPCAGAPRDGGLPVPGEPVDQSNVHDLSAAYAYALDEGIGQESAYVFSAAYADSIGWGFSRAYSIVYAAAYSIACSLIGASEGWSRTYAQACAEAITAHESIGFASIYGHAVADGVSPDRALSFARRYAA